MMAACRLHRDSVDRETPIPKRRESLARSRGRYDVDAALFGGAAAHGACPRMGVAHGGSLTTLLAAGARRGWTPSLCQQLLITDGKTAVASHDTQRDRSVLREAGRCVGAP